MISHKLTYTDSCNEYIVHVSLKVHTWIVIGKYSIPSSRRT